MLKKSSSASSSYIEEAIKQKNFKVNNKKKIISFISLFFAFLFLSVSIQPLLSTLIKSHNINNQSETVTAASAGVFDIFCTDDLGFNMSPGDWKGMVNRPQPDATGRRWTLNEAVGRNTSFPAYWGESSDDDIAFVKKQDKDRIANAGATFGNLTDKLGTLQNLRSVTTCGVPNIIFSVVSTFTLTIASIITSISSAIAVYAFDSNIICSDPANPSGTCFNLIKVLGGATNTSGEGIIGMLTNSIYMPLLSIVAVITAITLGYKGLVKFQIREAFFGFLWLVVAVALGLAFLLNPTLLAKAPMAVSNAIGTCVIGAFNGDNCMSNTSTSSTGANSNTSNDICKSSANVSLDEQMSMTVNALGCSTWKAFVLEPYSQGSFGTSFEDMDVKEGKVATTISKAGLDPNTFCMNLGSSASVNSQGSQLNLDTSNGGQVCNVVAYQLYLLTNVNSGGSAPPPGSNWDTRWYNIVATVVNDDGLWKSWTPSTTSGLYKLAVSGLSIVSSLAGSVIIIVISFTAVMYYLSSVFLMAFAPLFFLFGVHPGRGRKLFLGWVEMVVSNILKYLASALFLIVTIAFYGAVLGSVSNPIISFLFIVILTGALFMYRKEFMDLIGRVNMGGEQFSNKIAEKASSIKNTAKIAAGSAMGAAIAGGSARPMAVMKNATRGGVDGIKRDLKRGNGFVANSLQQVDRMSDDNKRRLSEDQRATQDEADRASDKLNKVVDENNDYQDEYDTLDVKRAGYEADYDDLSKRQKAAAAVESKVLLEMSIDKSAFAEYKSLINEAKAAAGKSRLAFSIGDNKSGMQYANDSRELRAKAASSRESMSQNDFDRADQQYSQKMKEGLKAKGVSFNDNDYQAMIDTGVQINRITAEQDALLAKMNKNIEKQNNLSDAYASSKAKVQSLKEERDKIGSDSTVTDRKREKIRKRSENQPIVHSKPEELRERTREKYKVEDQKAGSLRDRES